MVANGTPQVGEPAPVWKVLMCIVLFLFLTGVLMISALFVMLRGLEVTKCWDHCNDVLYEVTTLGFMIFALAVLVTSLMMTVQTWSKRAAWWIPGAALLVVLIGNIIAHALASLALAP